MKIQKISVIIPTYNEEKVIAECLNSLFSQTYPEKEVIIVDDGSTDKTLDILSELRRNNNNLKILQQNHQGPGVARNLGAKSARGKILVFVDADMLFDKKFLYELIRPINLEKARGTTSKEEYVANWDNVWARCWNINEGWPPKRRHRLNKSNLLREIYDFIAFVVTRRSMSLKNFVDYKKLQVTSVFRAILKSEFDRVGGYTPGGYTDDYSLSAKLGYKPIETEAKFYHSNPSGLSEVFKQAKWIGKRSYKLSFLGFIFALLRSSLIVSLTLGGIKSLKNLEPRFIVFKLVYDLGIFLGIINYLVSKRGAK